MGSLYRDATDYDLDLELDLPIGPTLGVPGKKSMTQSMAPRGLVFRVESPAAARVIGEAFGARDRNGVAARADEAVDRAAGSSGAPLRSDLRERFEASLGADLGGVRVHTGGDSAEANVAVGARAYTVGRDIHFGAGQYQPDDPFGLHLIAHEVAHTVQQAGTAGQRQHKLEVSAPGDALEVEADRAADAMVAGLAATVSTAGGVQRLARDVDPDVDSADAEFDKQYGDKYKRTRPKGDTPEQDFENERQNGKVKAASEQSAKATKVKTTVSSDQLRRIVMAGGEKAAADRIAPMAGAMSEAFATMLIDTAQAQADYIAHMAGETGGVLEEKQGEKRSYAPFQGRGPVQVTNVENYAKALGILQQRADQIAKAIEEKTKAREGLAADLEKAKTDADKKKVQDKLDALDKELEPMKKQLAELQEAIKEIKADPKKAADEKYAFLFSAAHMHRTGAVSSSGKLGDTAAFQGNGTADTWVTGGNAGMTFDQRQTQNEAELKDINSKIAGETDEEKLKGLQKGKAARERLIEDMKSAKSRGAKKEKVYAAGMKILSSENAVAAPAAAAAPPTP